MGIDNSKENPDIKIFVACHKDSYVPKNSYLYPVQVGTALNSNCLDGMRHDDNGENISDKNKSFCELTAHYWAWKNEDADYYGFFHYRRYFSFNPALKEDDAWGNVVVERITPEVEKELWLSEEQMRSLIKNYDIITVKGRKYHQKAPNGKSLTVYDEYGVAEFQHKKDLDITLAVIREKYPEYLASVETYMKSDTTYECNMFIMRRELYHKYCEWLFNILFEVENRIDTTWYSVEEYRVMGYLAERLFGVFYTHLKRQENIKTFELPKVLINNTAPKVELKPVFENAVPIVLSANDKFAPYLDIMIRSIVANASDDRKYDIIVLYNDISDRNRELISTAKKNKENVSIRFARVCEYFDSEKLFIDQHLSVETYYRLIIPEIMPEYKKILYLDCDMVADCDVAELYDLDMGNCVIAGVKDIDVAGQVRKGLNNWENYAIQELGLEHPYDYFQAGVLVIDLDKMRNMTSSDEMIRVALSKKWRCHDQDVLNVICKNQVYYLPQKWNVLMNWEEPERSRMQIMKMAPRALYEEYVSARKAPQMIHFAGYQKPWDVVDCDFANYFWEYAKLSPYYPLLLKRTKRCLEEERKKNKITNSSNRSVNKAINNFLPYGSKRREVIKKAYKKIIK